MTAPTWQPPEVPVPREHANVTVRESEVLTGMCMGLSNHEIALRLFLAEETIKSHARSLYRALGVHSRTEAVLVAPRMVIKIGVGR